MYYEIVNAGLTVERQKVLPIVYKDIKLDHGYRIDLLIENMIVIELKTVEAFTDVTFCTNIDLFKTRKLSVRITY